jgi:hypothetical protein
MRKGTGVFKKVEETIDICDFCKKEILGNIVSLDWRWSDGYDTYGDDIEACSVECLIKEIGTHELDYVFHGRDSLTLVASSDDLKKLFGIIS